MNSVLIKRTFGTNTEYQVKTGVIRLQAEELSETRSDN